VYHFFLHVILYLFYELNLGSLISLLLMFQYSSTHLALKWRLRYLIGPTRFQEAEKHLSDMVVNSKSLIAKIDRLMGVVSFRTAQDSNGILNSWATNLEKLLDLVEKSCHQIHKETMIHKAVLKA
jgi:hypothetical protein